MRSDFFPQITEGKGLRIPHSGFRIPDSGFQIRSLPQTLQKHGGQ